MKYYIVLNLSIFGGLAFLDYDNFKKEERILLFISGIIGNILLIIIFKDKQMIYYNLLLVIFNLLPIYPLDGFNILKEFSFFNYKIYKVIFIIISLFLFIVTIITKSFGIMLILIFLIIKNIKMKEEILNSKLKNIKNILKQCKYNVEKFMNM